MNIDSIALSQVIKRMANNINYSVKDNAPGSFNELKSCNQLVVWAGASDKTIYSAPEINWAFRAKHDSLHLELNAPFTLEGEIYVAKTQAHMSGSNLVGDFIIAEVRGQAEYYNKYGSFPINQREFIETYINNNMKL